MDPAELARLGVPTDAIDNGDGTWSMPVPQDFRPDELVEAGDMTWRYVGQGRYDLDPSGPFGELSYHYERPKFETTAEQLLVTQREDDLGRLWEVDSVDESKLSSTRVPSDYELMEADDDEPPEPQPGDELWWEPTSWIHQTCAGGWDVDIWDTDDRVEKPSPSGIRQQAMVQVTWSASGETGACSAVLLRNRWVLTAAHCLHKSNGTNVANSNITVWLLWANESRGVVDKFIADGYNYGGNGWDPDDDYALLKISSTFNSSPPDMDISSASDSDLNAVGANFTTWRTRRA